VQRWRTLAGAYWATARYYARCNQLIIDIVGRVYSLYFTVYADCDIINLIDTNLNKHLGEDD